MHLSIYLTNIGGFAYLNSFRGCGQRPTGGLGSLDRSAASQVLLVGWRMWDEAPLQGGGGGLFNFLYRPIPLVPSMTDPLY